MARRRVEPGWRLRVASYNIRKAVGLDWKRRPERILAVLDDSDRPLEPALTEPVPAVVAASNDPAPEK